MKLRSVLNLYSKASEGKVQVQVFNDIHTFSFDGIRTLFENDAPILNRTVGMIRVQDGNLRITAY